MAFDFPSGPTELQLYAPTGGPTYRYVAPGWRVVDSGTASFDPDSKAIFSAFTTPPTPSRKELIDRCVKSLKTSGVWDKLDALYAFAAADAQAAKINWKAPGTYNCTEINAPAFTVDLGFTGASTKYLDTGFNPTTAPSPKFTQNSASIVAWSTSVSVDSILIGTTAATGTLGESYFLPWFVGGGNYFFARVTAAGDQTIINPYSTGLGLWVGSRTSSSVTDFYRNGGASFLTSATASAAPANANLTIMHRGGQYSTGTIAGAGFGSGLSAAEQLALYNALNAYMTGLAIDRIFAAFTTPPTAARKTLITNCVNALVAAGVWDKLDALYAFAAADSQAARINWKNPGTFNVTLVNAPVFTADQGFAGNGTSNYLDSSFNPTTAPSPKFTQNSASIFGWSNTNVTFNSPMLGSTGAASSNTVIYPRYGTGNFYARVNTLANMTAASADSLGFWNVVRSGASAGQLYKNTTTLVPSDTGASAAMHNAPMLFLASPPEFWLGQIAAGGFGSQLSAADNTALYNALNAYMAGLYIATNTETNAIIAAFTNPPTPAREALIDNCVGALKSAGVWSKLDALYLFAAADSQAALINWKAPGTYNGTLVNSPAFVVDQGFTGAATKYIETSFNPSTAPTPKLTQNDGSIFAWGLNTGAATEVTFGSGASTQDSFIYPRYSGDVTHYGVNQSSNSTVASTNGSGLFLASRTGASAIQAYRNGVAHGALQATASAAIGNTTFRMMSRNGVNNYTGTITCAGFGSQVDSTQQLALYNALRAYMTGVGVP